MGCTPPPPPPPPPRAEKEGETRVRQTNPFGVELEGFIDWAEVVDNELAKEEEMFSLIVEFATLMLKRPATIKGEATSSPREKRPRRSPSDEEA